jgi:hypothetical protein
MKKPKHLAKYYSLQNPRYVHSVITRSQLFFADSANFNDPFEMSPALYRPKEFKSLLESKWRVDLSSDAMKQVFEQLRIKQHEKLRKFGVCCFTEACDNIVMWTHYADNHRGICLLFSTDYKFFNNIKDVQYVPRRPQMPLFERKDPARLFELTRTKLEMWSHEKEWRLFRQHRERNYKYPASALCGVIFGCRCTASDRDLVARLAQDRKVTYYEARMSQYEYELEVVEIQL